MAKMTMAQALVKFLDNQYVSFDGVETKFAISDIYGSKYLDVIARPKNGVVDFEVLYRK